MTSKGRRFVRPVGAVDLLRITHGFPVVTRGYLRWPLRGEEIREV
jgi:hypothetical protein